MDRARRRRHLVLWGLVALLAFAPFGSALTPHVSADLASGPFTAVARADGVSIEVLNPNTPLVAGGQAAFVSSASTQAVLDSLGTSQAFASSPYPGDLVVTVPGLVAGAVGGQLPPDAPKPPPLPDYPLNVSSSYPLTPESSLGGDPLPFRLEAKSEESRSSGSTVAAAAPGDPSAAKVATEATVLRDEDDLVVSTARSTIEGLAFGDVLRIGTFSTEAIAERSPGQDVQRSSEVVIAGVSVAGVPVKISQEGLDAAGTPVALPGLEPLAPVLDAAGIAVEYLPGEETENGVLSGALVVRREVEVPSLGVFTVIFRYGNVLAEATAGTGFSFGGSGSEGLSNSGASEVVDVVPAEVPSVLGAPIETPVTASPRAARPATVSASGAESPSIFDGPLDPTSSAEGFYLALVAAALVVLGGSELFSLVGIRLRFGPRAEGL